MHPHVSKTLSSALFLGSLDSKETRMLVAADSNVGYVAPGFLIYGQGRTLVAQPFDLKTFRLTGGPFPVADHVERGPDQAYVFSSASDSDVLVFGNEAPRDKRSRGTNGTARASDRSANPEGPTPSPYLPMNDSSL